MKKKQGFPVLIFIFFGIGHSIITMPNDLFHLEPKKGPLKAGCGQKLMFTDLLEEFAPEPSGSEKWKKEEGVKYVWREQARVLNISEEIKSYSGFFTVNKDFGSNMFFWFFPSMTEPETAPLIVFLNGGPGTSSLFGLFVENGPFRITPKGYVEQRQYSWTLTNSVLYIDNPVGTGFSFTNDAQGYSSTQPEIAHNLFQALTQFFRAFPEQATVPLFIAGESYGAKYATSLAVKIHLENKKAPSHKKMNLQGLLVGSGYFDPLSQNEYGEFLYNLGLLETRQRDIFLQKESQIRELIEAKDWAEATKRVEGLIVGDPGSGEQSLFQNFSGYQEYLHLNQAQTPQEYRSYLAWLNRPATRSLIHVGEQPYTRSPEMLENLKEDITKSVKPWMERLLKEGYRVLIYAGQLDIVVPHTSLWNFVHNLEWEGQESFARAPRRVWKLDGEVAGWTKFGRNLAYVLVRGAGHVAPFDQPRTVYEMVKRFTKGKPF